MNTRRNIILDKGIFLKKSMKRIITSKPVRDRGEADTSFYWVHYFVRLDLKYILAVIIERIN
jgi:hypothetical protein